MNIILDTNVILDAFTSREPWNKGAEKIFLMGANQLVNLYITASSATDIYYLLRKYLQDKESAKQGIGKLLMLMRILDITEKDCIDALSSSIKDYEDAVMEKVAMGKGIDYIVTRNITDFQAGSVKAILPDDFVKLMENKG
ncbi:MAG: PIN domain-containing protein [Lachnospiraceae bacterium]|nr:PIN domain-containing protein [Lachnospiraceae bacterium]